MKYDDYGRELPDDTPVEVPLRFKRPPSIQELIAMHVKSAMQVDRAMGKDDEEDFDEEQEFDDVLTPYELHAYAGEADQELKRAELAQKLVDRASKKRDNKSSKGGSDEKGTGGRSESGKEASAGVGRSDAVGSEDKEAGKAGRKVVSDDRGEA